MNKKKIYYAHSIGVYNTHQEKRDIQTLEALGFEVVNPNNPKYQEQMDYLKQQDMEYKDAFYTVFGKLVEECDALAFRAQLDGLIGAGVATEIGVARKDNKPVIEFPSAYYKRVATPSQTRAYLEEIGHR